MKYYLVWLILIIKKNSSRELSSVHSWIGKGFELAADSLIQTQYEKAS